MAEEEREEIQLAEAEEEIAVEENIAAEEEVAVEEVAVDAHQLVGSDSEEAHSELAASDIGAYGDIIEGFSVEANVRKVSTYIKLPEKVAKYILAVLYLAVGVLCAAIPERIETALPYIVGGAMAAVAITQFIFAIIKKEYRDTHTNKTAGSLIVLGLSVMIIIEHQWAHTFIPIVWGVIGLFEGAHAFNHAISRISRGMRSAYYIIKGIIEVAVAFLLLYEPEQYGELHIIVFGVSLMLDGITTLPFVKNFVAKR
ncbi:MAG: DUF308 domain-containing protein [Clostridia bacterium]|nr:DUF308 domain-containing protein [Clostridia bacterium]